MEEDSQQEPEQDPRPTEEGSPIPDPGANDTSTEDIPQAD